MRELERPSPASDGPDGPVNSVGTALQNIFSMLLVGGLEHEFYDFPFSWEWNNHPKWRTWIFFRGLESSTTNHIHRLSIDNPYTNHQPAFCPMIPWWFPAMVIPTRLHLREVQALQRRHLQKNPLWLHRYELKSTLCGRLEVSMGGFFGVFWGNSMEVSTRNMENLPGGWLSG